MLGEQARAHLERAYREFAPDIWRAVYAYSGGLSEVADEAVAETYAQAGRALAGIRDLRPWLYATAFRLARRELKRRRGLVPFSREPGTGTGSEEIAAPRGEGVEEWLELLKTISPNQRGAFVLREVYGYSSREAAQLLGISEVAVRVHLHAARRRLRAQLQEVERL